MLTFNGYREDIGQTWIVELRSTAVKQGQTLFQLHSCWLLGWRYCTKARRAALPASLRLHTSLDPRSSKWCVRMQVSQLLGRNILNLQGPTHDPISHVGFFPSAASAKVGQLDESPTVLLMQAVEGDSFILQDPFPICFSVHAKHYLRRG